MRSASSKSLSTCPPNRYVSTGQSAIFASDSARSSASRRSVTVTRAPRDVKNRTAPTPPPKRPNPMTVTERPARSRQGDGEGEGEGTGSMTRFSRGAPSGRHITHDNLETQVGDHAVIVL